MKWMLMCAVLSGCYAVHVPIAYDDTALTRRVNDIEFKLDFESYDRAMDKCFYEYDICHLKFSDEKKCWGTHEACVIAIDGHWQDIKRAKGYK